jgi:hypothetical protein
MHAGNVRKMFDGLRRIAQLEKMIAEDSENFEGVQSERRSRRIEDYSQNMQREKEELLQVFTEDDIALAKSAYEGLSEKHKRSWSTGAFLDAYRKLRPPKDTNEADIRSAAEAYIIENHPGVTIKHEFTQWSLSVRPDIYAVADDDSAEDLLISVEVKSDKDNFDRLFRQLSGYSHFSTTIYVALDEKHLKKYKRDFGTRFANVGVLVWSDGALREYSKPHSTTRPFLYDLLYTDELYQFFSSLKGRSKIHSKSIPVLQWLIENIYTHREIIEISQALFLNRMRAGYPGRVDCSLFSHSIDKQVLFSEAMKPKYWHRGGMPKGNRLPSILSIAKEIDV